MSLLPRQAVLTFHGLGPPPDGTPDVERPYWVPVLAFERTLARTAEIERVHGIRMMITFDDGLQSDHAIAWPRLARAGRSACIFPVVGEIGASGHASLEQLREMHRAGLMIGSHGLTHTRWTTLSDRALRTELIESRDRLADGLGAPVTTVSVPFGAFDRRTIASARAAGYTTIFTSAGGLASRLSGVVPRTTIRADFDPFTDLDRLVSLANRARSATVGRLKRWLVAR